MIVINYPEPHFKIKEKDNQPYIFDAIRKSWVRLTDEEWVRQNFVSYLIIKMQYPSTVIALEKEILLNDLKKRFDVLVYNSHYKPWMLIECKALSVTLNVDVLEQVLRYNMSVPVTFLVITNGNLTFGWEKVVGGLKEIEQLPSWE